jgi:hypothetical protein
MWRKSACASPVRITMRTLVIADLVSDRLDQTQPGVFSLHHHIEQDHGDVVHRRENPPCRFARIRRDQLDRPAAIGKIAERQRRYDLHGVIVVDHQDAPGRPGRFGRGRLAAIRL